MSQEKKPDPKHAERLRFCQEMAAKCRERDKPYWERLAAEEMKRALASENPFSK